MSLHNRSILAVITLATLAACAPDGTTNTSIAAPDRGASTDRDAAVAAAGGRRFHHARVCGRALTREASCHAWIRVSDETDEPFAPCGPSG
jgi:hypothetical protein